MNELALATFAAWRDAHASDRLGCERAFAEYLASFDERAVRRDLAASGIRWVGRSEPRFPDRLRSIHDPPPGLFLRGCGDVDLLDRPVVAIVGARSCSDYGAHVARTIARELAGAGVVVLSGLARGIDGWAHRGALEVGGVTVAVLGCGVDRDYPRAHAVLAEQIARESLIVSEYPPGVLPAPWRFPARNRIVAGIALATVVVEARERSGALITADLALEEGREVLSVPGEITSALSRGTNALIRLGATPVTGAGDVLEAIGLVAPPPSASVSPACAPVLAVLAERPMSADEIARSSGLPAAEVASALLALELDGRIGVAGGIYRCGGAPAGTGAPSAGGS